jgi:hypothetical protein
VDVSPAHGGEVEVDGDAPSLYPSPHSVERGGDVSLEAVPAKGYQFVEWVGESVGIDDPKDSSLEINQAIRNMTLVAVFAPDAAQFSSDDEVLNVIIPNGTTALDSEGRAVTVIEFSAAELPLLPEQTQAVGLSYNLGPGGAVFDPPITIAWNYDSGNVPAGVAEEDLVIAYYDEDTEAWVELSSEVDADDDVITAEVAQLTVFALLARSTSSPVAAAFTTSSLSIDPLQVGTGEPVNISVLLTNTGGKAASYPVTLTLNGVVVEIKEITVAGGESREVLFVVSPDEADTYSVEINGLAGSFVAGEAIASPASPPAGGMEPSASAPPVVNPESSVPSPDSATPAAGSGNNLAVTVPIYVGIFLAVLIPVLLRRRRTRDF